MTQLHNPEFNSAQQSFFPIGVHDWRSAAEAFSPMNDSVMRLVISGNTHLLDPDDPIRHLVELRERPELISGRWSGGKAMRETLVAAYSVGVSLSATAMRMHAQEQGISLPVMHAEPGERYLQASVPLWKRAMRRLIRPLCELSFSEDGLEMYGRLPKYLAGDEGPDRQAALDRALLATLMELGSMNEEWREREVSFANGSYSEQARRYMLLGIGDALELSALLCDESVRQTEAFDTIQHGPHHFTPGPDAVDLVRGGIDPNMKFTPGEFRDEDHLKEVVATASSRQRQGGFVGRRYTPITDDRVSGLWNTDVPVDTRIESVCHFESGYTLLHPGGDTELSITGDRRTMRVYKLQPNDALIVADSDGNLSPTYFPFITRSLTPKRDQMVEILGMCRSSRYIPLKEKALLGRKDGEVLDAVVTQVLESQELQRYGRVGQFFAEHNRLIELGYDLGFLATCMGSVAVYGVAKELDLSDSMANGLSGLFVGSSILAGLRLINRLDSKERPLTFIPPHSTRPGGD
jgi:hypothetical protein